MLDSLARFFAPGKGVTTSQGVPLTTMQEFPRYWSTDYDWHKCEAKLNIRRNCGSRVPVDVHMAKTVSHLTA
jgi:Epoxide hydrolase N terminus